MAEAPRHDGRSDIEASSVSARTRVLLSFAAGIVVSGIAMLVSPWQVASLAGWDIAAAVFIGWVWLDVARLDASATASHAGAEDDSRPASEIVLLAACAASLVGVALAVLEASSTDGTSKVVLTAVASVTVVLSWGAVHTVYTLRYARLYYLEGKGIDFAQDRPPDYGDFAYLAFTIGMTYQVSDTRLTTKEIRMTALRHALLSFVFGTSVVAMLINVVAGLFGT